MNHDLRRTILRLILAATLVLPASAAFAQGEVIVATDAFDRPDETPFAIGGNWSRVVAGNYDGHSVLSGSQVHSAFNEGIYYWTGAGAGTFSPTRQFARATVVEQDGEVGLVLLGGADQAIMVGWGPPGVGTTVYIYWYSGGLDHGQLATGPSTLVNGDVIEASLENGLIHARVNGTTVLSVANSTTLTSGVPGFITYLNPGLPGDVGIIDDWEAGTPEAYSISGTILEDAAGLSGVLVSASGGFAGSATTNGSGQYTITGVPPGATSITLTPTLSGHAMSPLTHSVAGPVAADVPGQDFTSTVTTDATLTINASHGSVLRDPIGPTYALGTPVTLTPVPDPGYSFVAWSGDVPAGDETDDPLVVTMDQDRSITATFVAPNVVAADDFNRANETPFAVGGNWAQSFGGGFVNLSGNHVVAGGAEALYYWQGSGTFDNARQFARLKVDQAAGQVGLILLGAANQALVVSWNAGTLYIYWYTGGSYQGNLTTTASTLQNGDVIEALLEGGVVYAKRNGAIVTSVANTTSLVAGRPGFETFQTGASFDDWEAGTPESFSLGGTITESAMGLGGVLVTASGGFSASTTTNGSGAWTIPGVPLNATGIVLTPTLGGHTMSPLTRTIPGPVTANVPGQDFTSVPNSDATLTVLASHGSVLTSPAGTTFPLGTPVTLTPVPDPGYAFVGWSGDVPIGDESDNPLVVTMDQDRTIAASFQTPDVIAADDFNRANETPLAIGGNWTKPFGPGTVNLSGNQAVGAGAEALYYWQGPGTFDNARQFARSRVVDAGGQVGLILLGAPNQALVVAWNAGTLYVYWYLGGSHQGELVHEPSVLQDGDEIEAELDNGIIRVKINGAVVRTVANTTSLVAGHPGFETFQTGAIFDDWEAGTPPVPDNIAAVPAPGSAITLGTSCVSVPVVFTRTDATPLMGYSVTFELSANLSLCGAQIVSAGYPQPPQQFLVTPLGGQRWTVDEVTLGSPCGSTGSGTLFTLQVTSATGTGTGTITIESVRARNCLNQSIPAAPGTIASIPIDREAPVRTLDLVATQVKTGNYVGLPDPPHSTTPVRLDFTVPPDAAQVEVYRRPFGGYPQYDENGGSIPALPPALPGAGWTLTAVTASGQLDEPAGRDFWYYALVARDTYGNASAV